MTWYWRLLLRHYCLGKRNWSRRHRVRRTVVQDLGRSCPRRRSWNLRTSAGSNRSSLLLLYSPLLCSDRLRALNRRLRHQELRRRRWHDRCQSGLFYSLHRALDALHSLLLQLCLLLHRLRDRSLLLKNRWRVEISQARYMEVGDVLHLCLDAGDQRLRWLWSRLEICALVLQCCRRSVPPKIRQALISCVVAIIFWYEMFAEWSKTEVEHWVAAMSLRSKRSPALARRLLQILLYSCVLLHHNCRCAREDRQLLGDAEGLLLALLGVHRFGRALSPATSWILRLEAALQCRGGRLSLLETVFAIANFHACGEYLLDVLLSGSSLA